MASVVFSRQTLISVFCIMLASCGPNQIALKVSSSPIGAAVVQGDSVIGQSGVTYYYNISETDKELGYINIRPLSAKWPSGAVSSPLTRLHLATGSNQAITFQRPSSAPNLSQDLANAATVTEQRLRRQQIQEAERQRNSEQGLLMMQQGLLMMQGNSSNYLGSSTPSYTGQSSSTTAFLKEEYTQGFSKICLYDRLGSVESLTLGAAELCPLTK